MDELMEMFSASRADIDSVPYAHEDYWTDRVGDLRTEVTR
jgi:hypothetical protein